MGVFGGDFLASECPKDTQLAKTMVTSGHWATISKLYTVRDVVPLLDMVIPYIDIECYTDTS